MAALAGNTPRTASVSRKEMDKLAAELADVRAELSDARKAASETHAMIQALHQALMKPSPGQEESLLDRMAAVTINIESGGKVSSLLVRFAALLAAVGSIWAAIKHGWI